MAPGPQVGSGSIAIIDPGISKVIGYIGSYYSSSGFREVIVAKRNKISVPVLLGSFTLDGSGSTIYSTPQAAESAFKTALGISSNGFLDRWWVTSGSVSSVSSYASIPQGFGLLQVARAYAGSTTNSVWAEFTQSGSSSCYLKIARPSGASAPDVDPGSNSFEDVTGNAATLSDFENIAGQYISGYSRWECTQTITKYTSSTNYPSNW